MFGLFAVAVAKGNDLAGGIMALVSQAEREAICRRNSGLRKMAEIGLRRGLWNSRLPANPLFRDFAADLTKRTSSRGHPIGSILFVWRRCSKVQVVMSKADRFPALKPQSELTGPTDRSGSAPGISALLSTLRELLSAAPASGRGGMRAAINRVTIG
jgi:hypothetical protein